MEFYTGLKSKTQKEASAFEDRMRSCNQDSTFKQMHDYLDSKSKNAKMPVRNFYDNTFGQILNDAIFALKRRQTKSTGEEHIELQHHQGQIKFVADFILNKLPAGEMTVIEDEEDSN